MHMPLWVHHLTTVSRENCATSDVTCILNPHPGMASICFASNNPMISFAMDIVGSLPFLRSSSTRMVVLKGLQAPVSAVLHTCEIAPSSTERKSWTVFSEQHANSEAGRVFSDSGSGRRETRHGLNPAQDAHTQQHARNLPPYATAPHQTPFWTP